LNRRFRSIRSVKRRECQLQLYTMPERLEHGERAPDRGAADYHRRDDFYDSAGLVGTENATGAANHDRVRNANVVGG